MKPAHHRIQTCSTWALWILLMCLPKTTTIAQVADVFELSVFDKPNGDTVGFVSLSEVLRYSEHPDSIFLPNIAELPEDSAPNYERIVLPDSIRKPLLQSNNIREIDRVFVYEYAQNTLFSYPVKDLLLVAYLSPYVYEWPYTPEDYMLGFEFSKKQLHGLTYLNEHALLTIGKKHPFELGKMQNLVWKQITAETIPTNAASINAIPNENQVLYTLGDAHTATLDTLDFYTRELQIDGELAGKNLVVLHHTTHKKLFEHTYLNGESTQLAEPDYQYAGILFKNQSPVVMGFTWESFGCPGIQFINREKKALFIKCDNRH